MNTARFNWLASCRNTIREIVGTWNVPRVIAGDIQKAIAFGCTELEVNSIAKASRELRNQVGF